MNVALRGKFSYGKKLRSSQSHDIIVNLPVTSNGWMDFEYMEEYIACIANEYISGIINHFNQNKS